MTRARRAMIGFLSLGVIAAQAQQYVISTYAGGGPPPTPAPGLHMWFDFAQSVATDQSGNVYFSALHCVFKLEATSGIVTRVAGTGRPGFSGDGGAASSGQLNRPNGLALDAAGNLFIADSGNDRISKGVSKMGRFRQWRATARSVHQAMADRPPARNLAGWVRTRSPIRRAS
jgi:hypothetical protein